MVACWRVKYGTKDAHGKLLKRRLPPHMVGPHVQNRDGLKLNADRCEELLIEFLGKFDPDEADHDCIAIEEKPGLQRFLQHYRAMCDGDDRFARSTLERLDYGSLGHTHVNQTLKNVEGGGRVTRPEALKVATPNGILDVCLVRLVDADLAQHSVQGCLWEILPYQIEDEEPDAPLKIQSVYNRKHLAGMSEHAFQHVIRLTRILHKEQSVNNQVSFEACKLRLKHEGMGHLAQSPDFKGFFAFALEIGPADGVYMMDLSRFIERFVNAKLRRLKNDVWGSLADLPCGTERVRNALIKRAFKANPNKDTGFCEWLKATDVAYLLKPKTAPVVRACEEFLTRFHVEYAKLDAYKKVPPNDMVFLWAKIDQALAEPLLDRSANAMQKLLQTAHEQDAYIRQTVPKDTIKRLPAALAVPGSSSAVKETSSRQPDPPAPKAITYDEDGKRTNEQDEVKAKPIETQDIPWDQTLVDADVKDAELKSSLLSMLWWTHRMLPALAGNHLRVSKRQSEYEVIALRPFAPYEIRLLPLVRDTLSIQANSSSTIAIPSEVVSSKGPLFYVQSVLWKPDGRSFVAPFWAVKRIQNERACNMVLSDMTSERVLNHTFRAPVGALKPASGAPGGAWEQWTIPFMTNERAVDVGEELKIFTAPKKKPAAQLKVQTWKGVRKS